MWLCNNREAKSGGGPILTPSYVSCAAPPATMLGGIALAIDGGTVAADMEGTPSSIGLPPRAFAAASAACCLAASDGGARKASPVARSSASDRIILSDGASRPVLQQRTVTAALYRYYWILQHVPVLRANRPANVQAQAGLA